MGTANSILEAKPLVAKAPKRKRRRGGKAKGTVKRRSAAAAALKEPLYRKRVVRSAKLYRRKPAPVPEDED
jgi:hypothetical protein